MKKIAKIFSRVFVWAVMVILYFPLLLILLFSFNVNGSRVIKWDNFQFGFDLYGSLFQNEEIMSAVFNTIFIAVVSSFIATIIAALAGVGILAMQKHQKNSVMLLNQVPIINADIVTAFSLALLFFTLGLMNIGLLKLIIVHILISLPFVLIAVLPRIKQLDPNLYDASLDLGATPSYTIFHIILPQIIPALISGFLLGFTLSLDDFVITQYNTSPGINTISTLVYSYVRKTIPAEFRALSSLILLIVVGTVLILAFRPKNRYINEKENKK
jgi:spermidine/putrescine transport system permease protein